MDTRLQAFNGGVKFGRPQLARLMPNTDREWDNGLEPGLEQL